MKMTMGLRKLDTTMFIQIGFLLSVVGGLWSQQAPPPASTCQDLDTQACQLFQTAKPDLCSDPAFYSATCKRFCGMCPLECYSCPQSVLDPKDCNVTLSCGLNMTCLTKHLKATDGHDEYILMCEKKEICDGFGFGFGKRDIQEEDTEDGDVSRYQRDVSLSCCDTDFCNMPSTETTTAIPATTTQVTSSSSCFRDIIFLIDDSGSVGATNFKHSVDFIKEVVNNLNVGPTNAYVAVLEYSTHPQASWYLSSFPDRAGILQRLGTLRFLGGSTHTGEALEAARVKLLASGNGERPAAENVVIVLTDGRSTEKTDTLHQANLLHMVSTDVVSIVVGHGIDKTELNAIATDPNHVFDLRSYGNLPSIVPRLLNLICT